MEEIWPREEQGCFGGIWVSTSCRAGATGVLGKEEDRVLISLHPEHFSSPPNDTAVTFCLSWHNLPFLLSFLIPISCTCPVPWARGGIITKCHVSSKLKILQYVKAWMSRSKAALHMCSFVSTVTYTWNTLEMCTAWLAIANHRSSFLSFLTNFPWSAALADILSNVLWLAAQGGLEALLHICAMQKTAEVTGAVCQWFSPSAPIAAGN